MAIMIGITEKGFKDICIIANSTREGKKLVELMNFIDPELQAFEELINKRVHEFIEEVKEGE